MTNEERDLINAFIARVGGAAPAGFAGSVPQTGQQAAPPLPPVDPEADQLIGQLFARYPEARYRITQMAFVQEHALVAAQGQIGQLQQALTAAHQQLAQAQQMMSQMAPPAAPAASPWGAPPPAPEMAAPMAPPLPPPSRGLLGGLFGGRPASPPPPGYAPPPPPGYAPPPPQGYAPPPGYPQQGGYAPPPSGMFQRGGSGFLGSALTTAAGVAGGMLAGRALMNMFSPHTGAGMGMGGLGGMAGLPGSPATPSLPAGDSQMPKDSGWTDAANAGPANPWGAPEPATPASDSGWQNAGQQDSGGQDSGWTTPVDDPQGGDPQGGAWSDPASDPSAGLGTDDPGDASGGDDSDWGGTDQV